MVYKLSRSECIGVCRNCGNRQVEKKSAFSRKTVPRCSECGGILDASDNAKSRMTGTRDNRKDIPGQKNL